MTCDVCIAHLDSQGLGLRSEILLYCVFVRVFPTLHCFLLKLISLFTTVLHAVWQDNGIKVVDMDGCMLADAWEPMATRLANVP